MLDSSNFIIEWPEIEYDREGLKSFANNIVNWAPNLHFMAGGVDTSLCHFYDYYVEAPLHSATKAIHVNVKQHLPTILPTYKFTRVLSGGVMPFHIDPQRGGVLMIPISSNPSKVCWKNKSGEIIFEHTYRCPTIINAKLLHGVPYTPIDRVFLQGSVEGSWESLVANRRQI